MRQFYTSYLLILFPFVLMAQPGKHAEPGKCYAKCLIPSNYRIDQEVFYLYTGEDFENNENIDFIQFEVPAHSKWIPGKPRKDCFPPKSSDCLTGRWDEVPKEMVALVVVKDIDLTDEYEMIRYPTKTGKYGKETYEWREVYCDAHVTHYVVKQIQQALENYGYFISPLENDNILGPDTKKALVQFQKDHGLPVGNLDLETFEALDIRY